MDTEILAQAVDKSQMPPLHQKRVLAFINHFIINSCNFLNDFALKCESKFVDLERKMQKVEAALTIIEAKLASVPDVTDATTITASNIATEKITNDAAEKTENKPADEEPAADSSSEVPKPTEGAIPEPTGVRACEDVRFKKFFKMVQFGVPAGAVKIKMQAEGVQPSILEWCYGLSAIEARSFKILYTNIDFEGGRSKQMWNPVMNCIHPPLV